MTVSSKTFAAEDMTRGCFEENIVLCAIEIVNGYKFV